MIRLTQITGLVLLLLCTSCGWNTYYNQQVPIEGNKWYKGTAARFTLPITDTLKNYDFYITIGNTTDYRYSNLYLFISTRFPNGNISRDTLECLLADEAGKWYGKGWGKIKDNSIKVNQALRFPLTGTYEFLIQQAMREDTLSGISNIGIIIEGSK